MAINLQLDSYIPWSNIVCLRHKERLYNLGTCEYFLAKKISKRVGKIELGFKSEKMSEKKSWLEEAHKLTGQGQVIGEEGLIFFEKKNKKGEENRAQGQSRKLCHDLLPQSRALRKRLTF